MKFMLDIRLRNVEHEDVVCRLFPYTFEGNASTWYFAQQPRTIASWEKFESIFLEKFGDGQTSGSLSHGSFKFKNEC
jgi:hypothetical protein